MGRTLWVAWLVVLLAIWPGAGIPARAATKPATSPAPAASSDLARLRRAAEAGDTESQYALAARYGSGDGMKRDLAQALAWLARAARGGHALAAYRLGAWYDDYAGDAHADPPDAKLAVKWYRQAAARGEVHAMFNLGLKYQQGRGVPRDLAEAARWYRPAADRGVVQAQRNMGDCSFLVKGAAYDPVAAAMWYGIAADQGDAIAQALLEAASDKLTPKQRAEARTRATAWRKVHPATE